MTYQSLYRKFRPLLFKEMVGQDHITKTLKNQIIENRVGHAYIFSGGRGTGKTSAAKILSRAVNCLNLKSGEPCNECEICKSSLTGSLTDIVEMDAASNNSVEDIRNIREEVNFLPTTAKYRVYIIDEAHMLSTGAFNALLKTLEEPPEHAKFILATTEPQKLPLTILSRCQRFDFKKIHDNDIITRLEIISKEMNLKIGKEVQKLIAILSEGAMRDALSILERCIQDEKHEITIDSIKELVGIPKLEIVSLIVRNIIDYNVGEVLNQIDNIIDQGKDITNFLWEIIKYTKDILVFKANGTLRIYTQEELEKIRELSDITSKERLLNMIYVLSEIENNIKWSSQKIIIVQTGLINLCNNKKSDGIEERISRLEEKINKQNINTLNIKEIKLEKELGKQEQKKEDKKESKPENKIIKQSDNKSISLWQNVLNRLKETGKVVLYTNLLNTTAIQKNDLVVEIEFNNGISSFAKTVLEKSENKKELEKLLSIEYGNQMKIKYVDKKSNIQKTDKIDEISKLANDLNIPINIIEE